jgi:hypothetical protein
MTRSECIDFVRKSVRSSLLSTCLVFSSSCLVVLLCCLCLCLFFCLAFAFTFAFALVLSCCHLPLIVNPLTLLFLPRSLTPWPATAPLEALFVCALLTRCLSNPNPNPNPLTLTLIPLASCLYLFVFSLTLSSCLVLFFLSCLLLVFSCVATSFLPPLSTTVFTLVLYVQTGWY